MSNKVGIPGRKQRGNGQGSFRKLPDGSYEVTITTEYYWDPYGKERRHVKRKRTGSTDIRDAEKTVYNLWAEYDNQRRGGLPRSATLAQVYAAWEDWYSPDVDDSTMTCYKAAYKHVKHLENYKMADISITDWQTALDKCPAGKRTRQNLKCLIGLLYKYAIPRDLLGGKKDNLGPFLKVRYKKGEENIPRQSLTDDEIALLWETANAGDEDAQDVICLIYLGGRPSEFLDLRIENLSREEHYVIGGSKTDAGRDRIITISPKIWPWIEARAGERTEGYIFCHRDSQYFRQRYTLKRWTDARFYPALERAGISNPLVAAGGGTIRHRITPHSCRHTFARLAGRVNAPTENISLLLGHSQTDMSRAYMDLTLAERRRITDQL